MSATPLAVLVDTAAAVAAVPGRNAKVALLAATLSRLDGAEIAPAIVAETVEIRMSRCLTCASSWAITPRNSLALRIRSSPVVAATAACSGLRPVANAFGASSLIR